MYVSWKLVGLPGMWTHQWNIQLKSMSPILYVSSAARIYSRGILTSVASPHGCRVLRPNRHVHQSRHSHQLVAHLRAQRSTEFHLLDASRNDLVEHHLLCYNDDYRGVQVLATAEDLGFILRGRSLYRRCRGTELRDQCSTLR